MKKGLCLAGGGVKGAAHIGAIKALEEANIKFDCVGGTSSGSIVACLYACGFSADEMYKIFKKYCKKIKYVDIKNIFELIFGLIFTGKIIIKGLNSGKQIERLINKGEIKVIKKCDDLFDCLIKKEKFISNKKGEYTDLYDENKNLTGEKLFREKGTKLIVPKGRYSIVVLAFIENSKGEFLFQMTSKRKKNVWATTGGHVKSGQTSKEAIIEEIKEELGIDINEDEVKLFKTYKYDDAFKDVFYIKKDIDINSLTYEKDEVEYVKYLTKEEILDLINNNGNIRKTNIDAFLDIIN